MLVVTMQLLLLKETTLSIKRWLVQLKHLLMIIFQRIFVAFAMVLLAMQTPLALTIVKILKSIF